MARLLREKTITFSERSACCPRHALVQALKRVQVEVAVLKLTKERDLTETERWMLPPHIQLLPRQAEPGQACLVDLIGEWTGLQDCIEWWISQFSFEEEKS